MSFVQEAMGDADAVLFVTDLFEVDFSSPQVLMWMQCTSAEYMLYLP